MRGPSVLRDDALDNLKSARANAYHRDHLRPEKYRPWLALDQETGEPLLRLFTAISLNDFVQGSAGNIAGSQSSVPRSAASGRAGSRRSPHTFRQEEGVSIVAPARPARGDGASMKHRSAGGCPTRSMIGLATDVTSLSHSRQFPAALWSLSRIAYRMVPESCRLVSDVTNRPMGKGSRMRTRNPRRR
jgi:hypothetical protein